jgi:hypothetical protein
MQARFVGFGRVELDGQTYDHDIVIDRGTVRTRHKKPSKAYRDRYGHTPLSAEEDLPWHGSRLIIGTGTYKALPVMQNVFETARDKGVELIQVSTPKACDMISAIEKDEQINVLLHLTC